MYTPAALIITVIMPFIMGDIYQGRIVPGGYYSYSTFTVPVANKSDPLVVDTLS